MAKAPISLRELDKLKASFGFSLEREGKGTLERYRNSFELFVGSLGKNASQPVTSITPSDIETFVNRQSAPCREVSTETVIGDLKTLNTPFPRAENYGVIWKNPVAAIQPPKNVSSEREIFTHEEVEKLINVAPTAEWQILIMLGYFLGARLGECVHMR